VTDHFPLGTTTVNCTTDGGVSGTPASASATITVQDTTAPSFGSPPDVSGSTDIPGGTPTVTYTNPPATDAVSGTLASSCSPSSGTQFPIGSTTVTCTATDAAGNQGSGMFTVRVDFVDDVKPTLTVPGDATVEATGPSGAVFTYSATATDNVDTPSVSCSPSSGSTFPIGDTTVNCAARDVAGNEADGSFHVVVTDTTKPQIGPAPDINDTTNDSGGKNVSFPIPPATDSVDGSLTATCSPASGSHFNVGTTPVTCTAADAQHNSASTSFNVKLTFVDNAPPVFANVPADLTREANGPSGSVVTYTNPTATDAVDGPIASVNCTPASGATFPLGTTTVACSASDSSGNAASASFRIAVVDTTPPRLIPPGDREVYATNDSGIYAADDAAAAFVRGASATDIADAHPTITSDAPSFFPVGQTVVTFVAHDSSGNTSAAKATLTVRSKPSPGATPPPLPPPSDRKPPAEVSGLGAVAGDRIVTLRWSNPADTDFAGVVVSRARSGETAADVVYRGSATTFTDRAVVDGVEYRYVVVAVDKDGNASTGVAVVAQPQMLMLRSPRNGTVVKKPPKLVWLAAAKAAYYNVQLFRGSTKILSAWPKKTALSLQRKWNYKAKRYRLTPGAYTWYVWPGFGAISEVKYGPLLGSSSFTVR
jgi:hypothetical protein